MKKSVISAAVVCAVAALGAAGSVSASETAEESWAYAAYVLDSEENGIGSIYYAEDYFTTDAVNPTTTQAYTEEEITAITEGAEEGAEGYFFGMPEDAVIGISAYGQGTVYWFDADGAAEIVSHSDQLTLDVGSNAMVTAEGEEVAAAFVETSDWAYAALALNSEENGVGSIYYAAEYFTTDAINPTTTEVYTEEELASIRENAAEDAEGYLFTNPAGAVIGMNVYNTDQIFWYDAESAAEIVSHSDPLILDTETGELADSDGNVVASPME